MKNKRIFSGLLLAFIMFVACNDFLDREPYASLSSGNMFTSATLAEGVVTGAYSVITYDYTSIGWDRRNWDAFSSVLDPLDVNVSSFYSYMMGTIQTNDELFSTYWKILYEGVNRTNDVINNIEKVPDMSAETKSCRIAECKFLRAYSYYRLNALWRGVPVYLENLAPSEYTKERSTEQQVWQQVIDDCTAAIESEALPEKYDATNSNYGRVTKGAAYALRGKAYLWLKMWKEAADDFKKVGECGYSLHNGSYASLFTVANERSNEMIFSVQMVEQPSRGNVFGYTYGNFTTTGNGKNGFILNTNFVDTYEEKDGTPFNWENYIPGYHSMTPEARSVYFLRNHLTDSEKITMATYGADMSKYDATGNEARILAAYRNRDPRLAATAITPYSTYVGGSAGLEATYTSRFPYRGWEAANGYDLYNYFTNRMNYVIRKFVPTGRTYTNINYNPLDAPIIRYADVLLCLAEALNEQGLYQEAIPYVNQVRNRAGVSPLSSNSSDATYVPDANNLRKRIRNEKKWELACELQLYYDELRWGTWKETKFAENNGSLQVWGSPAYKYRWGGDAYLKWAIPQVEVEKNSKLKQNENWK